MSNLRALLLAFLVCVTPLFAADSIESFRQPSLCSVSLSELNVWGIYSGWNRVVNSFQDRTAAWLSPGERQPTNGTQIISCTPIPSGQKAVFVSTFQVKSDGRLFLELIIDNVGTFHLSKVGQSQEIFNIEQPDVAYQGRFFQVGAGIYQIAIESYDYGTAAGTLMSLSDTVGRVLLNTADKDAWKVYLAPANTNVSVFTRE